LVFAPGTLRLSKGARNRSYTPSRPCAGPASTAVTPRAIPSRRVHRVIGSLHSLKRRHLMPIDQTVRGLALEIDASTDPAPEAQPLLEYRFIDLASTQTILARIKGIPPRRRWRSIGD